MLSYYRERRMKLTGGRMSRAECANRRDTEAHRQEYRRHGETSGRHLSVLAPEFRNILGFFVRPVLSAH